MMQQDYSSAIHGAPVPYTHAAVITDRVELIKSLVVFCLARRSHV